MNKVNKLSKKAIIIYLVSALALGGIVGTISYKKYTDSFVKVASMADISAMFSGYDMGLSLRGKLKAGSTQDVHYKKDLTIKEVKVEKGDTVKVGDVLIEYDTASLQLKVEEQKKEIAVSSNDLKIAENNLEVLKNLKPADNAQETESEKAEYEQRITKQTTPLAGNGAEDSPFIFNVSADCVVTKEYMQYLAGDKSTAQSTNTNSKFAMFHVYNETGDLLYSWLVDGAKITDKDINDWHCNKGVVVSGENDVQVEQGENIFAKLVTHSVSNQNTETNENTNNPISDGTTKESYGIEESTVSSNDDYVYTQDEIQKMISEQEEQISDKKLAKDKAEFELKKAEQTLKEGNETASIFGTVTFVAKSKEEAESKGAYIKIVNDSVTTVIAPVNEKDLPSIEIGMEATINTDFGNEGIKGKITNISTEVSKNTSDDRYNMYDDASSYYDISIEMEKNLTADDDSSLMVTINTNAESNTFTVESAFVRYDENGKSYVMVANEHNVLEKRYVEVGKVDVYSVEIVSGLSMTDRIAVPYGKATEGAPTVNVSYSELASGRFF